jgi:hypothetical protein
VGKCKKVVVDHSFEGGVGLVVELAKEKIGKWTLLVVDA